MTSFIYISTAYSQCIRDEIGEKVYETPITGQQFLTIADILSKDRLEKMLPTLIGKWPNNYVFTKALAEDIVKTEGIGLPVAITRPSIVIGTYKEPLAGWIDTILGATGIFLGVSLGLIHTLHCNPDAQADMVPADYFINCTIAAAWNTSLNRDKEVSKEVVVYNYVCSPQKPITWKKIMSTLEEVLMKIPSPLIIWYPYLYFCTNKFLHNLNTFFMHTIPAHIADLISVCIGKEARLVKGYKKIHKFLDVIAYFSTRQWVFHNDNTQSLWRKLSEEDQQNFEFDMGAFSWEDYFPKYVKGGRVYLLKDPLDTIPQGQRNYRKLQALHYCLMVLLFFILYKTFTILWYAVV